MDMSDIRNYGEFGFRKDYVNDPNDIMSIYNARREVMMHMDNLPLSLQIKTKRCHDSLSQEQLGKILRLPASTISLIETGQRLIPQKSLIALAKYLYADWYVNGELIYSYSEDEVESVEPVEEMDIDAQRAYWKAIFNDDPDMHGTIL